MAAQGRVLQVQGQACPRPRLVGQHRLGRPQPDRLLREQFFFMINFLRFPIFAVKVERL